MSDHESMSREERLRTLDAFAGSEPQSTAQLPAVITAPPPPALIHGSQPIAGALRDDRQVLHTISVLAAQAGDDFVYSYPVTDTRTNAKTTIEGLSIGGAMAVLSAYRNADVNCWVSGEGPDFWEFTARFIDLEGGVSVTRPFRQRKGASRMGRDNQRNLDAAYQIGVSKAERNVIVKALPTHCDFAFNEAKNALVERIGRDLPNWRSRIAERLEGMKIPLARVEAVVGRKVDDWLAPDVAKVVALGRAIADGMASIDETFPPLAQDKPVDERAMLNAELDKVAASTQTAHSPSRSDAEDAAGAPAPPPAAPAAARDALKNVVNRLLGIASAEDVDTQFRLAQLDEASPWVEDQLPGELLKKGQRALYVAARLARGEMSIDEARKALQAL